MFEVRAYLNPSSRTVDVYVRGDEGFHVEQQDDGNFCTKQHNPGDFIRPAIRIPETWAAALAVAIQESGCPAGRSYERGRLEAMEKHLEDMREFFKKKAGL